MAGCELTKHQYQEIRLVCKNHDADVFPPYDEVLAVKKRCYPPQDAITVTEEVALITLQALADKTGERIVEAQEAVLRQTEGETLTATLDFKGGFDGSSAHSVHQHQAAAAASHRNQREDHEEDQGEGQREEQPREVLSSDKSLLFTSIVPLRLSVAGKIAWLNDQPNSGFACRPYRLQFAKESKEKVKQEMGEIEAQTHSLLPCSITMSDNRNIVITHKIVWSMLDGKAKAYATDTATQTCNICGAVPSQMNNIENVVARPINQNVLKYGLSPLHALLRFFSLIITVGTKLVLPEDVRKYQIRGKENQKKVAEKKREMQDRFYSEMGLLVDFPKSGGVGNTTNGNTVRRAFEDPAKLATITGVSEELIRRFSIVLLVMRSNYAVDIVKFREYCLETAKLYVSLYGWHYMSDTVHEVLIHGWQVLEALPLPPGLCSEEAQKSRNKHIRNYRLRHTRKDSPIHVSEDLQNMLLVTSDPVMLSLQRPRTLKKKNLPKEMLDLLASPSFDISEDIPLVYYNET